MGGPALEVRMTLVGGATGSAWVVRVDPPDELAGILDEATRELGDVPFDGLADLDGALRKLDGVDAGLRPGPHALRGFRSRRRARWRPGARLPLWRFLASPDARSGCRYRTSPSSTGGAGPAPRSTSRSS